MSDGVRELLVEGAAPALQPGRRAIDPRVLPLKPEAVLALDEALAEQ
jgi:hypothetical protein